jgi:hypothetical protein
MLLDDRPLLTGKQHDSPIRFLPTVPQEEAELAQRIERGWKTRPTIRKI